MIMSQIASAQNSDDENKAKENKPNKDPMRFVYKTKVPHETIVFNLTPNQSKMTVKVKNRANAEQSFQGAFSIEDLPDAFQYFDTILHFYQDMRPKIQKKQANIELTSLSEDIQVLKIRMKMYKQILSLDLRLERKFVSQIVKQTRNLKMLTKEQKQQEEKLKDAQKRQGQLDSQMDRLEKQLTIIKKQQINLLQNSNRQLKQQLQEETKERTMIQQVMIRRQQVMELYCKLIQKGYQFTQKQLDLRKKLISFSSEKKGKKRIFEESSSQSSSQSDLAKGFQPIKAKGTVASHPHHSLPKQETINEIIIINSETDNLNEVIEDIKGIDLKNQIDHAESEPPNVSFRRLQLDKNESKELSQEQQIISFVPIPEEKISEAEKNRTIQNKKAESFQLPKEENEVKPHKHEGVVILSSEQSVLAENSERLFGKKVKLDFSASQNFNKYQQKYSKGGMEIQKSIDDKSLYHIYHKQPIRDFQNMQFTILGIQKRDLTFGIMKKDFLKSSRLSWSPKSSICWVGCSDAIFPDNQHNQQVVRLRQSDHITVSVNTTTKVIKFKVNESVIERNVPDDMLNQCYFFIETATKGNKISCKY